MIIFVFSIGPYDWPVAPEGLTKGCVAGVTEEKYREELHLFSDPESDWTDPSDDNTDLRPESDQRTKRTRKS